MVENINQDPSFLHKCVFIDKATCLNTEVIGTIVEFDLKILHWVDYTANIRKLMFERDDGVTILWIECILTGQYVSCQSTHVVSNQPLSGKADWKKCCIRMAIAISWYKCTGHILEELYYLNTLEGDDDEYFEHSIKN